MGSQQQAPPAPDSLDALGDRERSRVGLLYVGSLPLAGPLAGDTSIWLEPVCFRQRPVTQHPGCRF